MIGFIEYSAVTDDMFDHGYLEKMDMNQDFWVFKIGVTSK